MIIAFDWHGDPVPKARARTFHDGTKYRSVTPARVREFESAIGWAFREAFVGVPFSGDVAIEVDVFEARWPGDADNYAKAILDALNGIAWNDDRQVVAQRTRIRRGSSAPGVHVVIDTEPDPLPDRAPCPD